MNPANVPVNANAPAPAAAVQAQAQQAQAAPVIATWSDDATRSLIRQRRRHHQAFDSTTRHDALWTRIANHIINNHNFQISATQCRNKWYSLTQGYENARIILQGNPEGLVVRSPNHHDCQFHFDMSDEFWNTSGNPVRNAYRSIRVDRRRGDRSRSGRELSDNSRSGSGRRRGDNRDRRERSRGRRRRSRSRSRSRGRVNNIYF